MIEWLWCDVFPWRRVLTSFVGIYLLSVVVEKKKTKIVRRPTTTTTVNTEAAPTTSQQPEFTPVHERQTLSKIPPEQLVSGGHLDCLKYGCPWDVFAYFRAAKNGHLECLKYLQEKGCPN